MKKKQLSFGDQTVILTILYSTQRMERIAVCANKKESRGLKSKGFKIVLAETFVYAKAAEILSSCSYQLQSGEISSVTATTLQQCID